jgi:hypothetical protein
LADSEIGECREDLAQRAKNKTEDMSMKHFLLRAIVIWASGIHVAQARVLKGQHLTSRPLPPGNTSSPFGAGGGAGKVSLGDMNLNTPKIRTPTFTINRLR